MLHEAIEDMNKILLSDEFFKKIDLMKNYRSGFYVYNFSIESLGLQQIEEDVAIVNTIRIRCHSAGLPIDYIQLQIPIAKDWWNDCNYQKFFKSNICVGGKLLDRNIICIQFKKRWLNIPPNYIDRLSIFSYIESCVEAFEIWNDNK